jgi:hypothetical protein
VPLKLHGRHRALVCLALGLLGASVPRGGLAGLILRAGDIVVGDASGLLLRIDPVTGAQATFGEGPGLVAADLAVDAQRRVYALTSAGIVVVYPQAYDPQNPNANWQVVWSPATLCGATGFGFVNDGSFLVACYLGDSVVRAIQNPSDPSNPDNTSIVSMVGGVQDVAIDPVLGTVYATSGSLVIAIAPHVYDPQHPAADQSIVGYGSPSLILDFDRRPVSSGPNIMRLDPTAYNPLDPGANNTVVGDAGGLGPLALEQSGNFVGAVLSNALPTPSQVIRFFPAAYDPSDPSANQQVVSSDNLLTNAVAIAVVPEPASALVGAVSLVTLVLLLRLSASKSARSPTIDRRFDEARFPERRRR